MAPVTATKAVLEARLAGPGGETAALAPFPEPPAEALASCLDAAASAALAARINAQAIMHHLGGRARVTARGAIEVDLPRIEPFHLGGMEANAINGATLLAMLDCALVGAGLVQFGAERCATMEMAVKIMRPVLPRGVRALGYAIGRARNITFTRADIYDLRGKVRVTASGIVTAL